ncbi:MAG: hypothetical protein ACYTGG_03250 [Planctomycetota bacterium]|jgi:hypothetical protein
MSAYLRRRLRPVHGLLIGGAWFFVVVSLLHLAWVVGAKLDSPGGATKLYHTVVDGVSYDALGLTYHGPAGIVQAVFQAAIVFLAATVTLLPWRGPRTVRLRRLGHVALVGWSGLWAANLLWLTSIDGQLDSVSQSSIMCVLLGCTVYRAVLGWSPPSARDDAAGGYVVRDEILFEAAPPHDTDDGPAERTRLTSRHVRSSAAVREIRTAPAQRAASWLRSTWQRLLSRGRAAAHRVPRPTREQVRRAAGAARREAASGLRHVARFTARQADRLGGRDGTKARRHAGT